MQPADAAAILRVPFGLDAGLDPAIDLRTAYLTALKTVHPDRNDAPDAADRTMEVNTAYRCLVQHRRRAPVQAEPSVVAADQERRPVVVDAADSIRVAAPRSAAVASLVDAATALGEITYLDPAAGLVQIVVEFTDAPTAQILLEVEAPGGGASERTTIVSCSVDAFNGGEVPASRPVVDIVAAAVSTALSARR